MCEHEEISWLGTLGFLAWGRCRACGLDMTVSVHTLNDQGTDIEFQRVLNEAMSEEEQGHFAQAAKLYEQAEELQRLHYQELMQDD